MHNLANIIRPVSFSDCPGWDQDDQALAFSAFRRSADYAEHNRYNSGSLGISFEALTQADQKSVGEGKSVDIGGRRIIKKKNK